jgi:hypothetical protein
MANRFLNRAISHPHPVKPLLIDYGEMRFCAIGKGLFNSDCPGIPFRLHFDTCFQNCAFETGMDLIKPANQSTIH